LIFLLHQLLKRESSGCGAKGSNPTQKNGPNLPYKHTSNQDMLHQPDHTRDKLQGGKPQTCKAISSPAHSESSNTNLAG